MKKIAILLAAALLLASCQSVGKPKADAPKPAASSQPAAAAERPSPSYAFGLLIGENLRSLDVSIDYGEFTKGVQAALESSGMKLGLEEANAMVQAAIQDGRAKRSEANIAAEKKFLSDNGKKKGVVTTASGLQYEILAEGAGPQPRVDDVVKVDYEGKLLSGKVFDSSIARGEPVEFRPDQVIRGWAEALQLMRAGSKYMLYIPAALAYGEEGAGNDIGPNEMLIFEVRLLGISASPEAAQGPGQAK